MPDIPGYNVFEQRRAKGKRGGFATLVKKGLNVTRVVANDYALLTELLLPGGDRVAVVNVYMPPIASIKRKRLSDEVVQEAVCELVAKVPHDSKLAVVGDFNARTGTLMPPDADGSHRTRVSTDGVVCARGKWLAEQWQLWACPPLNGSWCDRGGASTCTPMVRQWLITCASGVMPHHFKYCWMVCVGCQITGRWSAPLRAAGGGQRSQQQRNRSKLLGTDG